MMNFSIENNGSSSIILYMSDPREVRITNTNIIKKAQESGYVTVIVTTNFPAAILEKLYRQNDIDPEKIYFIDAISKYSGGGPSEEDQNHIYTKNPADLTSLGIAITKMLKTLEGRQIFVLIDSVSTMLIYLPSAKISQFMHFIASKLRQREESGAILAVDGGLDPMLLAQMSSFVDEIVDSSN